MKLKYILGATALSLILAGTAYPQQEQEKEKPHQQEEKPAEKPKTQQKQEQQSGKQQQQEQKQQSEAARQNEQRQSEETNKQRQDQEKQATRQQQQDQKQEERQQQQATRQQRGDEHQNEQRNDQRSGGGHGRIPDERFHVSFGREHHFRVGHVDNRRFQYGGYWFVYNDPWPGVWSYDDDFYIDYIDGQYYLIDLTHPGVQLLLVVQ